MKCLFQFLCLCFSLSLNAQFTISGKVENEGGEKLYAASVFLKGTKYAAITDEKGQYTLENVAAGDYVLKTTYLGYGDYNQVITIESNLKLDIVMEGVIFGLDAIQINSTWVDEKQPFAYSSMGKEEIEVANLGQDVPFVLKWTPSLVVTSDAGAGIGYTGMRIRGSDPTRINVTINGIPLNDAESHNVFWVDLPDFLSSVDQIQIQRGVGTSTNGASAFGASINLNTQGTRINSYAGLSASVGSYNTLKYSARAGTGLMNDKFSIDARVSKITSDGYIDRALSDLNSIYFSASRVSESSSLKLLTFHGSEVTYQAWNGLPIQLMDTDRTFNPSGMERAGEPHDNEVDDYDQTHVQLLYDKSFSESSLINLGLHYTKGKGFFEQYKAGEDLADYSLPTDLGETDLIRRRWLDNDFYGLIASYQKSFTSARLTIGGAYNIYQGRHFGEVIWTENETPVPDDHTYYDNDAEKNDGNIYAKVDWDLTDQLLLFGDLQYRVVNYEFLGFDANLNNVTQTDQLNFFNPKLGISYLPNERSKVFASLAVANKEPNRNDYTESSINSRPLHETLYDLELGYEITGNNYGLGVNVYNMQYDNQLVTTGLLNDVGAAVRENVGDSYRRGIEIQGAWQATDWLNWSVSTTFSQNKIDNYVDFIDYWDTGEQEELVLGQTDLALSPNVIASNEFNFGIGKWFNKSWLAKTELNLLTKYVGEQFIDNTSLEGSKLPGYSYTDLRLHLPIDVEFARALSFTLQVNNVFNALYSANAWIYRFRSDGFDPVPFDPYAVSEGNGVYNLTGLYPQAERNFLLSMNIEF